MSAPFDQAAPGYDTDFTHTRLARELRAIVWRRLADLFAPGQHLLELACGTGEDARHLAVRGVRVLATDQSSAMLDVARRKTAGLPVVCAPFDVLTLAPHEAIAELAPFDGVFSNFGGLNVLADYAPLARWLAPLVPRGGRILFVVMGRWCAWEVAWHLARAQPRAAFRRLGQGGALARVGNASLRVHYPSTSALRRAFAPHFRLTRVRPLGLTLPPSYLERVTRWPFFPWRLFIVLDTTLPLPLCADHTMYEWIKQ